MFESLANLLLNNTDTALASFVIIVAVFALGDVISYLSKSYIAMLLAAAIIFMALLWNGLPDTIFNDSGLVVFAAATMGISVTNMGTIIDFAELKRQWKTIVVAVMALVGIVIFTSLIGSLFVGKEYAFTAGGPISGGIVAVIIAGEKLKELGLPNSTELVLFATMLVTLQAFVGYPLASVMLKKEARRIKAAFLKGEVIPELTSSQNQDEYKRLIKPLPEKLQTTSVIIAKLGIVALLAIVTSKLFAATGMPAALVPHRYVLCILFGIAAFEIGFLEKNALTKANSQGILMISIFVFVVKDLGTATPEILASIIVPLLVTLGLGAVGVVAAGFVSSKMVGISPTLAMAIGASAMIGFPGTFMLSHEVANAESTTDAEKEAILAVILPKMIIGGFATVTVGSVFVASILMNFM